MCAGGRSVPVVAVCNSSNRKRNKPLIFLIQTLAKEQEKGKHSSVWIPRWKERVREMGEGGSRKQKSEDERPQRTFLGGGGKVKVVKKVLKVRVVSARQWSVQRME